MHLRFYGMLFIRGLIFTDKTFFINYINLIKYTIQAGEKFPSGRTVPKQPSSVFD